MAVDLTAIVDPGARRTWTNVQGDMISPIAEIIYHGTTAIPSLLAADQTLVTLELQLPSNFVYRMVDFHLQLRAPQGVVFSDFSPGASFEFQNAGVITRVGQMLVPFSEIDPSIGTLESGGYSMEPGVLNDMVEHYVLDQAYDEAFLITADGQIFMRLADASTDATVAAELVHHCRVLQYTIEQFDHAPMHSPLPIINP